MLFGALVEEVVLVPLHRRTAPSSISSPYHPSSTRLSHRAHAHAHPPHTAHHAPGRTRDAWSHSFLAPSLQAARRETKRQQRHRSKSCYIISLVDRGALSLRQANTTNVMEAWARGRRVGGKLGCVRRIHNLAQFDQFCLSVVEHLAHSQFVLAPAQLGLLHPPHLSLFLITVLISRGSAEGCAAEWASRRERGAGSAGRGTCALAASSSAAALLLNASSRAAHPASSSASAAAPTSCDLF